jgi:tRNA G18 (ribose-2'-O)-methylase SpoU
MRIPARTGSRNRNPLGYTRAVAIDVRFLTESALDDPRLADYRELQDRKLGESSGRFIAESELVVRKLLATDIPIVSLLLTAPRLASLEPALAASKNPPPVFVVPQAVMDGIAGFHVHRGCLAIAERPHPSEIPADAKRVVVLVDLVDVDNLGAMARNAAAFGVDALLLSPRCADPFYRKAVRTSAGAVLSLPIVRARRWPDDLLALRARGFSLAGAVLGAHAISLSAFEPPPRLAILFGSEGPGLDEATRRLCDTLVTIPMAKAPTVDSLNVATAGAVFLYHVTQFAGRAEARTAIRNPPATASG